MKTYKTKQEKLQALMNGQRLTDKEYPDIHIAKLDYTSNFGPFILKPLKNGSIRKMDGWWSDDVELIDYDEWKEQEKWPNNGDEYYFVTDCGHVIDIWHASDHGDTYRKLTNNTYRTEITAKRARDIDLQIREIAARHPIDWSDGISKARLVFDIRSKDVKMEISMFWFSANEIWSADVQGFLSDCKEEIGEANLIWYHKLKAGLIKD